MEDCIFCKIAKGEIPSSKILENDKVIAFLDLAPASKGHALVVPKAHAETILDLPPGYGEALVSALATIGKAQMEILAAEGFNCLQNNFPAAGQEVMHLHWHVIPRFSDDTQSLSLGRGEYENQEEMDKLAGQLNSLCRNMR